MKSRMFAIVLAGTTAAILVAFISRAQGQNAHSSARMSGSIAAPDPLSAQERANFRFMVDRAVGRNIIDATEAMPADKFGFAPTAGEFKNVRTFSQQVRHLAATNFILAAAALGQDPPADAGDEAGPDTVITKRQHVEYVRRSFDALDKAVDAIGDRQIPVGSSPISPFHGGSATRIALITEAITHAYDHYGQMVVYLRMNGVVPSASRR
jgi:uncharacterized damage-inducible protein DinB